MKIHNLGFPRIGLKRELKFLLENYWQGKVSKEDFLNECKVIRKNNWALQLDNGIEELPAGDFAHYDQMLNTSLALGIIPKRINKNLDALDTEFSIARGKTSSGCGCAASDMTKWFNTNYHYIVPELSGSTAVKGDASNLIAQIKEAKKLTDKVKPVLIGPITYLYLSTAESGEKLDYLPQILAGYQQLLDQLNTADIEWLQIDEPVLGLELTADWQQALKTAYSTLNKGKLKLLIATYFASVNHHKALIAELAIDGLHIDNVAEKTDIAELVQALPESWVISLGVINGRNIWKTNLVDVYQQVLPLAQTLNDRLWLAPSCSLQHSPVDLDQEQKLDSEIQSWLAFAKQKCQELKLLKKALVNGNIDEIKQYSADVLSRLASNLISSPHVQTRLNNLKADDFKRSVAFTERKAAQQQLLNLPIYPTTTIGSFPQTGDIRETRAQWRRNEISDEAYNDFLKAEIKTVIDKQEAIGLDVLVHGEPERNDMVEYFGELLEGVVFTQFAWVQSYGSRCVKPPIIFGDISRKQPMTVSWTQYAQSLTNKPVKAMLTGPVTILAWSFVRDDLSREQVTKQIALAIGDEVSDLVAGGTQIIQIDEPAIREGMPVKESQWAEYLAWATASFRLSASTAPAQTQVHTHMCYSDFNEILSAIVDLDADVLTVETARSQMALLDAFEQQQYPNDLGPGVYDIHSPNVPDESEIIALIKKAEQYLPKERLWVNPDCGLKTRAWPETEAALINMVSATQALRAQQA